MLFCFPLRVMLCSLLTPCYKRTTFATSQTRRKHTQTQRPLLTCSSFFLEGPLTASKFFSTPGAPSTMAGNSDHSPEFCLSQPLPQASLHPGPAYTLLPRNVQGWKSLTPCGSASSALAFVLCCLGWVMLTQHLLYKNTAYSLRYMGNITFICAGKPQIHVTHFIETFTLLRGPKTTL